MKSCFFLLCLIFFLGFGSCNPPLRHFCERKLPSLIARMETAKPALAPWFQPVDGANAARELASTASESKVEMAGRDRNYWKDWAEENLLEVQKLADALEEETALRNLRKELSEVAKEFVIFYGFSEQGDAKGMVGSLQLILENASRIQTRSCPKPEGHGPSGT